MKKYLQCKFEKPNDFLGLDITHQHKGEITLSMKSFTTKMKDVLQLSDSLFGDVLAPGRTDKKISIDDPHEPNDKYRSYVGTLNWLSMGLRYDMAFVTKELSPVLDKPTPSANEIANRALNYAHRTKHAHLKFSHTLMTKCQPPKTRKKPTEYEVNQYNTHDDITHTDEIPHKQNYTHQGEQVILTCLTDID